jgi:lipopolysaccharide/colanic/teichoic acid biosynthesis glycosyltransferase
MTLHLPNLNSDIEVASTAKVIAHHPARWGVYRNIFKRVFDISLILLASPVALPVVVFLALAVMLGGGNPFYTQLRVGKNGRHFRMWKLRSMVKDADAQLESYLAQNMSARTEWDATQKLKNDPRITRVGRILRKTSLDELPQLWNVLNGTMSLVGPRPMMVEQERYYYGRSYYDLRPGITGLWQISDRNECNFVGRVAFDETYNRKLSLMTDIRILKSTVGVVMRATGH